MWQLIKTAAIEYWPAIVFFGAAFLLFERKHKRLVAEGKVETDIEQLMEDLNHPLY